MAPPVQQETYVFSKNAVQRAIGVLTKHQVHEHFAGYLALLEARSRTGDEAVRTSEITDFHERYLRVSDAPSRAPFVSPFRSRGYGRLVLLNDNVAGSYAPSSLRQGKPLKGLVDVGGARGRPTYTLRPNHASVALSLLLYGRRLPAVAVAAFIFREYGFRLEERSIESVLGVFRDRFGLRHTEPSERQVFDLLFSDDTSNFSEADLELIPEARPENG